MIIYQSIPVTKHKSFNYTKTLRSVIAFLTMSGRSYWDLLSSEPQVRWKARPALLWVLLQKSCTEQKPMRLNRMSQNVNFVDWLTKKNIFFRCLKLWFFFIKDFHCAVPWPLPVLALLEEQLFAAWAANVVEVQNNERNRGWEVHLFLVAVLAGAYINRNDIIYNLEIHVENYKSLNWEIS